MTVTHDPTRHRFSVATPAGEAELVYHLRKSDGAMDLLHTFVPEGARGGTIASDLVETAIGHGREHGLKLVATCPYVQRWLTRHPEAADLFVK